MVQMVCRELTERMVCQVRRGCVVQMVRRVLRE